MISDEEEEIRNRLEGFLELLDEHPNNLDPDHYQLKEILAELDSCLESSLSSELERNLKRQLHHQTLMRIRNENVCVNRLCFNYMKICHDKESRCRKCGELTMSIKDILELRIEKK